MQLPSYSVLAPSVIGLVGARFAGTLAVVVATVAFADLVRGLRRATAASVAFALLAVLGVTVGRLTFALAFAIGLVVLVAVKRRRAWAASPLAVLCCMSSLLAAFFLGVALAVVAIGDRTRRLPAAVATGVVFTCAVVTELLFRQTGTMPFSTVDLLGASATSLAVACLTGNRVVRLGTAFMALVPIATMLVPGALGENVVRLSWFTAAPLLIAGSRLRGGLLCLAIVAVSAWPVGDSLRQLLESTDSSTRAGFYRPLINELRDQQRDAGSAAIGERLEVIPTRTHWETRYLTGSLALFRGWDRQADVQDDPIFYFRTLDAASYQRWLHDMAVGWVARPHAPLDRAGKAEADLVDSGLPYLQRVWHTPEWDLYRVRPASQLAVGARVLAVRPTSVTLSFAHAGTAFLHVRWTPYLVASPARGSTGTACALPQAGYSSVIVSAPGDYLIGTAFSLRGGSCPLLATPDT